MQTQLTNDLPSELKGRIDVAVLDLSRKKPKPKTKPKEKPEPKRKRKEI